MSSSVLVKLNVPMAEEQFDVWIPTNKKIHKVIKLLIKGINEFCGGEYNPMVMPLLYDKITAKPYDLNATVKESNIQNASELILI